MKPSLVDLGEDIMKNESTQLEELLQAYETQNGEMRPEEKVYIAYKNSICCCCDDCCDDDCCDNWCDNNCCPTC